LSVSSRRTPAITLSSDAPPSKLGINPKGEALKRLAMAAPSLNADENRHALYKTEDDDPSAFIMLLSPIDIEEEWKYAPNADPSVINETAVYNAL